MIRLIEIAQQGEMQELNEFASNLAQAIDLYRSGSSGGYVVWTGHVGSWRINVEVNKSNRTLDVSLSDQSVRMDHKIIFHAKTTTDDYPTWDTFVVSSGQLTELESFKSTSMSDFVKHVFTAAKNNKEYLS